MEGGTAAQCQSWSVPSHNVANWVCVTEKAIPQGDSVYDWL